MSIFKRKNNSTQKRSSTSQGRNPMLGYGVGSGGFYNPATGAGTNRDHISNSMFIPTFYNNQRALETLGVESWAAKNFIDMPVDDMFIRWRSFEDEEMMAAETHYRVCERLAKALKAARQFGSGLMVMVTSEDELMMPLMPERVKPGDLKNLLVLNRFEMSVVDDNVMIDDMNYGMPEYYRLHPRRMGGGQIVHHSRILRFDGIDSPSSSGFQTYDYDWGVSSLVPLIGVLMEDRSVAAAIAHLTQEASVGVLKVTELRQALAGGFRPEDPDNPHPDQIASNFNFMKTVFNLGLLDKDTEEYQRVEVRFNGLADLMDKFPLRIAAAARIPHTRFMGMSPAGLSSTGDADMKNYVQTIESLRASTMRYKLDILDEVVARSAGMNEVPEWDWNSLIEIAEQDQAEVSKLKTESVISSLDAGIISREEAREMLAGDVLYGDIDPTMLPPEPAIIEDSSPTPSENME